jgi:hypothetical protein
LHLHPARLLLSLSLSLTPPNNPRQSHPPPPHLPVLPPHTRFQRVTCLERKGKAA